MLNDTPESQLGPGVFLDTAVDFTLSPAYTPEVNVPVDDFWLQTRLGDVSYKKRFGVVLAGLGEVEPGREYEIIWRTPPGEAVVDNAEWQLNEGRTCGYWWCTWIDNHCDVTDEPYGVGVIEHGAHLSYQAPWRCRSWSFLPMVTR
jgi:hypothetical protein